MKYLAVLSLLASFYSFADVEISAASIRAPIPGMSNTAGYMTITNKSNETVTFVSASSNISDKVEFHSMEMVDSVMKMYKLENLTLNPQESVILESGGKHLMFIGLNQYKFESANLTLVMDNGKEISVTLKSEDVKASHHHHHH